MSRTPRRIPPVVAVLACGAALAAAQALAAPAPPTKAPSIAGKPRLGSQLTCNRGTWGADAKSFTYTWNQSFDPSIVIAKGQRWRPKEDQVGDDVLCQVTARDAQGAATTESSAPVHIDKGKPKIELTTKSPQHGDKVTLTGKVTPTRAIKPYSKGGAHGYLVAYRVEDGTLYQLFGSYKLSQKTGKFKIVAPSEHGKRKYQIDFNPNQGSYWDFAKVTKKVNLKND